MSVEFANAYQEILLDNLVAIIKQNFIFQTQLKLAEDSGKATTEIQAKYNELIQAYEAVKDLKTKVDVNASAHEDKSRLQSALNDSMKQNTALQKKLEEKDTEIAGLKEYMEKLESIATPSKLKKLNPNKFIEENVVEQPVSDLFAIKVNDGSSF
jgi:predicted RNase H-like nuclease (RuvC/YqgF family)